MRAARASRVSPAEALLWGILQGMISWWAGMLDIGWDLDCHMLRADLPRRASVDCE